ncbi:RnfABCDGE type electron transport complex subunit D [Chitinibacteraceae bacterium HSL-7]
MALTSPFFRNATPLARVMATVLLALLPAVAVQTYYFGPAILLQLLIATAAALATEAACLHWRGAPVKPFVSDGSAILTAWLLTLALPPLAPWWITVVGCVIAIALAKHAFGGLGQNLFNPAMVGFAVLLVSFPAVLSRWPAPLALNDWSAALDYVLGGASWDALASATPLDAWRTRTGDEMVIASQGGGALAVAYLAGGAFLLWQRVINWRLPVAFIAAFSLFALVAHLVDPARFAGLPFHLTHGAVLLGAFFIVTDPVSAPTSRRGQLLYAALAGVLVYAIRAFGSYPDGVAFAVLLANIAAPLIDEKMRAPVFGKGRS